MREIARVRELAPAPQATAPQVAPPHPRRIRPLRRGGYAAAIQDPQHRQQLRGGLRLLRSGTAAAPAQRPLCGGLRRLRSGTASIVSRSAGGSACQALEVAAAGAGGAPCQALEVVEAGGSAAPALVEAANPAEEDATGSNTRAWQ